MGWVSSQDVLISQGFFCISFPNPVVVLLVNEKVIQAFSSEHYGGQHTVDPTLSVLYLSLHRDQSVIIVLFYLVILTETLYRRTFVQFSPLFHALISSNKHGVVKIQLELCSWELVKTRHLQTHTRGNNKLSPKRLSEEMQPWAELISVGVWRRNVKKMLCYKRNNHTF